MGRTLLQTVVIHSMGKPSWNQSRTLQRTPNPQVGRGQAVPAQAVPAHECR